MRYRHALLIAVTVIAVVVAGCSDSGDGDGSADAASDETLSSEELRERLVDAGYDCGDLGPYEPGEDEMDIGVEPAEWVECSAGESTVGAAFFDDTAEVRAMTMIIEGLACSFGVGTDPQWIADGNWVVSTDDAEGGTDEDLLVEVGEALDVAPAEMDCPEDSGAEGSDGEDEGSGRWGTRDEPLAAGETHEVFGGWTLTATGYDPDATDGLVAEDEYGFGMNDRPEEGRRLVSLTVEATYDGEEESAEPFDISFAVVGASGVSSDEGSCVAEDPQWNSLGEVFPGGTLSGNLCFEIPDGDAEDLVLIVEPTFAFGGERAYLALG